MEWGGKVAVVVGWRQKHRFEMLIFDFFAKVEKDKTAAQPVGIGCNAEDIAVAHLLPARGLTRVRMCLLMT